MAQADSMPVLAMPADRRGRDLPLGRVVDGERARVSTQEFGVDLDELTHILVAGVSGSGKTSTLMKLLYEAVRMERTVIVPPRPGSYVPVEKQVPTGVLALDWMRNMRNLAQVVPPHRFRFFSIAKPSLGAFTWNPLAIPDDAMDPADWLAAQADNFTASWSLGEFGRSLIAELVDDLYRANRLEDTVLRPETRDADGVTIADAFVLPAIDPSSLPPGAIVTGPDGRPVANVYTFPPLSRLVGVEHLAVLVAARIESLADPRQSQVLGRAFADRLQSLWRRVQYFSPGSKLAQVLSCDPDLATRHCLNVTDLIDPDLGLVTVVETDGLDQANRRLILGSVMLATYRYGLHHGEGCFNHGGHGPGTLVVLEEAHELFGARQEGDDRMSLETRTALWESIFRRPGSRSPGLGPAAQDALDSFVGSLPLEGRVDGSPHRFLEH
jgi:DNA helicase HerA-like ATPase